jgi:hypothetical protein
METMGRSNYIPAMTRPILIPAAGALALAMTLGACAKTDSRLNLLTVGIGKDSVLRIMGVEKPAKEEAYLTGGKYIEALYFPLRGATDSASTTDRMMSPVVVVGGKLAFWGWEQWDSLAAANKIVVAPPPPE